MDPKETINLAATAKLFGDYEQAAEHLADYDAWVKGGGFTTVEIATTVGYVRADIARHIARQDALRDTAAVMTRLLDDDELLEAIRLAIEDQLIDMRDSRIFVMNNNGLVVKESDGSSSSIIRMSTRMVIRAIFTEAGKVSPTGPHQTDE